jgi:stage II sporulation protein D
VVEHIPLEEYLPGVVAKEMLTGWPLGAYQVQAVCARTYALHERLRTAGGGAAAASRTWFDVESSDRDQVYNGATNNKAAIEAVRSTRGWVLADGDQLLRAYFSSTCGGRTASARDTWPTGPGFEFNLAGPIQAHARESACNASPLFRWSVTRDRAELVRRLQTYGERNQLMVRKIKDLWLIEPLAVNVDGRPNLYKVMEPGGTWYQLSGEQLRLALNQSVPTPVGAGVLGGTGGGVTVPVQGYGAEASGNSALPVAPAAMPAPLPDVDRKSRVASSDLEVIGPRGAASATINGRGFGHGVGMCQYCAKAFAERGEDWRVTVLRFYAGARLAPLY